MKDSFQALDETLDGSKLRIAVVASRFNGEITKRLTAGALEGLKKHGITEERMKIVSVPGAFEIPVMALHLAETNVYDAVLCLGAVVRGETPHFDYICSETSRGIMNTMLTTGVPCGFGLLTLDSVEQGLARTEPGPHNKGLEAAEATVEMALHVKKIAK